MNEVTLGDVAEWGSGGTPRRSVREYFGEGLPWLSIADLTDGPVSDAKESLTLLGLANSSAKVVPPGALLIAMYGSIGKLGIAARELCTSQAIAFAIPDTNQVDTRYLFHFLLAQRSRLQFRGRGGTQSNISQGDLKSWPFPLPSLPEQRRIAAILDQADALRAKRRAAIQKLDELAQSIFLDMFGDPATNPKRWPLNRIGTIGQVVTGNTPSRKKPEYYGDGIEWIKSDNINNPSYYLTKAEESLSVSGRKVARVVPAGSILVTCIAGSPECIGNSAMTDREVAFNQQINAIVPSSGNSHFIYGQLRVGKRLVQRASTASMKGMVNKSRFESIELMWPDDALQNEFSERVQIVEHIAATQRDSHAGMTALFESLQLRAFRGDLLPSQAESLVA